MINTMLSRLIGIKLGSDYGVLSHQFVPIDPQFRTNFFHDQDSLRITIAPNESNIPSFFGNQINYISGIVGKNGVGKSTLIRYIKDLFLKESIGLQARENDVVLFQHEGVIFAYVNEKLRGHVEFAENTTEIPTEVIYYRKYPKIYDRLKNFTTVFYSNSLDQGERESETTNFFNISTNYLSENLGKINRNLRNKKIRNQGGGKRFRFTELIRQIDFVNAITTMGTDLDIPFKYVDRISLKIDKVKPIEYRKCVSTMESLIWDRMNDDLRLFLEDSKKAVMNYSQQLNRYKQPIKDLRLDLLKNIFEQFNLYLLNSYLNAKRVSHTPEQTRMAIEVCLKKIDHNFYAEETSERLQEKLRKIVNFLEDIEKIYPGEKNNRELINHLEESGRFLNKFFELLALTNVSNGSTVVPTQEPLLIELLKDFFASEYNFQFLSFSWPSLSAGESSLISFFSRFYSISSDFKSENVLLLIDEGDLYFHPEWQRDYIYFLLEFLTKMMTQNRNTSIILTTHSPFLLSDLPADNVILLIKDLQGKSMVARPDQFEVVTFGGNIHTLFSKAFFLDDTMVSRFAMNKIKREIIKPLQSQGQKSDFHAIDRLIDKVGEPVLKLALRELFDKKYDLLS